MVLDALEGPGALRYGMVRVRCGLGALRLVMLLRDDEDGR